MEITNIKILHPDTKKPVSYLDWKLNNPHPERAEWLIITTDELKPFLLHKNKGSKTSFNEALAKGNRLTRARGIALYEAKTINIDVSIKGIGGDPLKDWVWTCEKDLKPYSKDNTTAWLVNLETGQMSSYFKDHTFRIREVADYNEQ